MLQNNIYTLKALNEDNRQHDNKIIYNCVWWHHLPTHSIQTTRMIFQTQFKRPFSIQATNNYF